MHNEPSTGRSNPRDNICISIKKKKKGLTWQVVSVAACTTSNQNKLLVNWGNDSRLKLTGWINMLFWMIFEFTHAKKTTYCSHAYFETLKTPEELMVLTSFLPYITFDKDDPLLDLISLPTATTFSCRNERSSAVKILICLERNNFHPSQKKIFAQAAGASFQHLPPPLI